VDKPEPRPTGNQWDQYAEQVRKQLPAAPEGLLTGYMKWAPWVYIVLGAISVIFLVLGAVLATTASLLGFLFGGAAVGGGLNALVSIAVGLIFGVLLLVGGIQMRKLSLTGWWIIGVGIALNVLRAVLGISVLGLLISLAVAYVHLLVKPRYT
jgi:hypothetical protein